MFDMDQVLWMLARERHAALQRLAAEVALVRTLRASQPSAWVRLAGLLARAGGWVVRQGMA
jgi:hypothetical protein